MTALDLATRPAKGRPVNALESYRSAALLLQARTYSCTMLSSHRTSESQEQLFLNAHPLPFDLRNQFLTTRAPQTRTRYNMLVALVQTPYVHSSASQFYQPLGGRCAHGPGSRSVSGPRHLLPGPRTGRITRCPCLANLDDRNLAPASGVPISAVNA